MLHVSVLPVLPTEELAMPIFSFSLSSLELKSLRMVILTIMLVQVLCCHSITKIINGAMFVTPAHAHGNEQKSLGQTHKPTDCSGRLGAASRMGPACGYEASLHKRRLKCDTNISLRRLMTHLLHQMVHHRTTLRGNGQ